MNVSSFCGGKDSIFLIPPHPFEFFFRIFYNRLNIKKIILYLMCQSWILDDEAMGWGGLFGAFFGRFCLKSRKTAHEGQSPQMFITVLKLGEIFVVFRIKKIVFLPPI